MVKIRECTARLHCCCARLRKLEFRSVVDVKRDTFYPRQGTERILPQVFSESHSSPLKGFVVETTGLVKIVVISGDSLFATAAGVSPALLLMGFSWRRNGRGIVLQSVGFGLRQFAAYASSSAFFWAA